MAGIAIGDAMGDLGRSDTHRRRYGIITEMYEGAKSTDDTEFALLTARTLLDNGGELSYEVVERAWRRYILDQGGLFERGGRPQYGAVENLRRGIKPPRSGQDNVLNNDDGAAMRIAPVGIVYAGAPDRAAEMARIEAQISHDGSGVWSAQAIAAAVAVAMVDGTTAEIVAAMLEYVPDGSWLGRSFAHATELCERASSIEDVWDALHTDFHTREHAVVEEAMPQCYAIFRLTDGDFRKGMFWAANFGRDADTISAVVGALAGARHGVDVIPRDWIEKVRRPAGTCLKFAAEEDVIAMGGALAELGAALA